MLRVHDIDSLDCINTDSVALTIYFKGCCFNCKGCHNKDLQAFTGGTLYTPQDLYEYLLNHYDLQEYDTVCFLGGEPTLQHKEDMIDLTYLLYEAGYKVWLYTGLDYDAVPQFYKDWCYCIKAGKYDTSYPKVGKLATGNQSYYFKDGRIEK